MAERYPINVDVGKNGASIAAVDGFKLVIPPNAFNNVVKVQIAGPLFKVNYIESIQPVSWVWIVSPQYQELAYEGTIYIPFPKSFDDIVSYLRIYRADDAGTVDPMTWHPLPQVDSGLEGILAGKFTKFGAFFVGYEP